jgi:hypothetical protein
MARIATAGTRLRHDAEGARQPSAAGDEQPIVGPGMGGIHQHVEIGNYSIPR